MLGHLTRQVWPRQHADTRLRSNVFENLAHQQKALRLDALGGADQLLAAE